MSLLDGDALAGLHELIAEILDLTDAYRQAAITRGYSPTAAEQMAMEYHAMIWRQSSKSST